MNDMVRGFDFVNNVNSKGVSFPYVLSSNCDDHRNNGVGSAASNSYYTYGINKTYKNIKICQLCVLSHAESC